MAQDHLGLFDTPPEKGEVRFALVVVSLLFAVMVFILPFRDIRPGELNSFIPMINTAMLVGELIIATTLYAQAAVFRSRALIVLASGYLFSALMLIPHALTFPGAFSPTGLLDAGVNTTVALAQFRRFSIPIVVILYALLKARDSAAPGAAERRPVRILPGVLTAIALAASLTALATVGHDLLPPLARNAREGIESQLAIANSITVILAISAMALLFRQDKTVLDLWLLVAMSDWLFQSLLNLAVHTRFTFGFYGLYGMAVSSNLIVMLALVAETYRLYGRLALVTAARGRERETRLMSMDAVAAAIAHEIGQPLAAISLNTTAGLQYLKGKPPNARKAAQSLRGTQDASRRAFDVVKSVRTMFSEGMGVRSEFNLNELTRETATLLDREITSHKVALELDLDPDLPTIQANRVQVQRILINLITNSVEAMKGTGRRARRITIRSRRTERDDVQLEVSDSGVGIASDKLEQIFEPFVTSKKSGTGLGLSLCRTIVEEHGGKLWATPGAQSGVTFHLQIPRSRSTAQPKVS